MSPGPKRSPCQWAGLRYTMWEANTYKDTWDGIGSQRSLQEESEQRHEQVLGFKVEGPGNVTSEQQQGLRPICWANGLSTGMWQETWFRERRRWGLGEGWRPLVTTSLRWSILQRRTTFCFQKGCIISHSTQFSFSKSHAANSKDHPKAEQTLPLSSSRCVHCPPTNPVTVSSHSALPLVAVQG